MKKLISIILLITLTLALSGCGKEDYIDGAVNLQYDEVHDTWFLCVRTDNGQNLDCDIVYTKQEINEIIFALEDVISDELNKIYNQLDNLEDTDTYDRYEIELIIYAYELQKSISLIEDVDRELTSEEQLAIASYEILLNIVEQTLEEAQNEK